MSDFPARVTLFEEGPREAFQIEAGPIATADKIAFIEALASTGLRDIQCVSFVDPRRVPGMADAEAVVHGLSRKVGVRYTAIWLNQRGLVRAAASGIDLAPELQLSASETFGLRNSNRSTAQYLAEQRGWLQFYAERKLQLSSAIVMTAFGCNHEGRVATQRVCDCIAMLIDLATEHGQRIPLLRLADTVGWATPLDVMRLVGAVRERWPDLRLGLHLHDTRGPGLANVYAGLSLGVDAFDTACAGLGGCPFAAHQGAAGNVCTEDVVFLCHEMGIATGVDLDALIEAARSIERVLGRPLPGKVMHGGSLSGYAASTAGLGL